jgi:hypothetical protein
MDLIMATALVFCRTWPCPLLVVAGAVGAAAGAVAGYFAAQSAIKQYAAKTRA